MRTPAKYKEEFCEIASEILSKGKSLAAVCAHLDIARCTLYEWRESRPEFKEALDRGLQKAQLYWEELGQSGVSGDIKNFGGAPWIFTMKNRFRDDYKEDKNDNANANQALVEKLIDKLVE